MHVEHAGTEVRIVHVGAVDNAKSKLGLAFLQQLMEENAAKTNVQEQQISLRLQEDGTNEWPAFTLAGAASFGPKFGQQVSVVYSNLVLAEPLTACTSLPHTNSRIMVVARGDCMFVEKVRNARAAGAQAVLVVDNHPQNSDPPELFTMSGDGGEDPDIPAAFLHRNFGRRVIAALQQQRQVHVMMKRKVTAWSSQQQLTCTLLCLVATEVEIAQVYGNT
jgi:mannosidase alpha-like ER degradation enhancer 3